MKHNSFEAVKALTTVLVKIPSINKVPLGESKVAHYIYEYYTQLPYFRKNPQQIKCFQSKNDFVERHSTYAYVKGTGGASNDTIILIGHIDTVGIDDYGSLKPYACDPDVLPEKLKELKLSKEVLADLDSGEFLFGRGTLDMKSGVAGHMYLIEYFSNHPEELNGNLIAIAECDEEDNSMGILTALDELGELKEREGFNYVACINSDYSTNYMPGDENRYLYYGSVGKLLPGFVAFGKEVHVGQPFGALDPNLLIAEITRNLSCNTELCDVAQGEVAVPPISLKQMDTKVGYTVQTALVAMAYFNYFTHGTSPEEMLERCKKVAQTSFEQVIAHLDSNYEKFCSLSQVPYTPLPWKPRVYTWKEFYQELLEIHGVPFREAIHSFTTTLHREQPDLDLRLFSLQVMEEAWKWAQDTSPAIILYYGSIYSPPIEMTRETEKERRLLDSVERAVAKIVPEAKREIKTRMFYPYISDSSFMAIGDTRESIEALEANMPTAPVKYSFPYDKVADINVPVVNIGSFGRDGHMMTERVDMWHTFQNVPNLIYETILALLDQ